MRNGTGATFHDKTAIFSGFTPLTPYNMLHPYCVNAKANQQVQRVALKNKTHSAAATGSFRLMAICFGEMRKLCVEAMKIWRRYFPRFFLQLRRVFDANWVSPTCLTVTASGDKVEIRIDGPNSFWRRWGHAFLTRPCGAYTLCWNLVTFLDCHFGGKCA
jgi:hypothetical protein